MKQPTEQAEATDNARAGSVVVMLGRAREGDGVAQVWWWLVLGLEVAQVETGEALSGWLVKSPSPGLA